jgi:hypothetical protein
MPVAIGTSQIALPRHLVGQGKGIGPNAQPRDHPPNHHRWMHRIYSLRHSRMGHRACFIVETPSWPTDTTSKLQEDNIDASLRAIVNLPMLRQVVSSSPKWPVSPRSQSEVERDAGRCIADVGVQGSTRGERREPQSPEDPSRRHNSDQQNPKVVYSFHSRTTQFPFSLTSGHDSVKVCERRRSGSVAHEPGSDSLPCRGTIRRGKSPRALLLLPFSL